MTIKNISDLTPVMDKQKCFQWKNNFQLSKKKKK